MSARVLVVTGTDTEVGKTVATAALVARGLAAGEQVHLHKATQTGVGPGEEGDVQVVERLLGHPDGLTASEGVRLPEPLAPATAARRAGVVAPTVAEHAQQIVGLAQGSGVDTVVVEGAGGLLVEVDGAGGTLRDVASLVVAAGLDLGVVLVVREGLGTLNHTALTMEALAGLPVEGLVIGAASEAPGLAARCNLQDLPRVAGVPVLAVLPAGAGQWDPDRFRATAPGWFGARHDADAG